MKHKSIKITLQRNLDNSPLATGPYILTALTNAIVVYAIDGIGIASASLRVGDPVTEAQATSLTEIPHYEVTVRLK